LGGVLDGSRQIRKKFAGAKRKHEDNGGVQGSLGGAKRDRTAEGPPDS